MTLLKEIQVERAKHRAKKPLRKNVFNRISSIVKQYHLQQCFLNALDHAQEHLWKDDSERFRVRMKKPMKFPLFSLVTQKEYSITVSIMNRVENPYLEFVHAPEEILMSEYLYRLNPSIHPERLMRFHFETLVMYEQRKRDSRITIKETRKRDLACRE